MDQTGLLSTGFIILEVLSRMNSSLAATEHHPTGLPSIYAIIPGVFPELIISDIISFLPDLGRDWNSDRLSLKYAEKNHAGIVEAYPIDSGESEYPETYAYTGLYNAFVDLGFKEVERRSPKRPIMRYYLDKTQ